MKTTVRIGHITKYKSPAHLLVQAGYTYYIKRGGGHSYIKKDDPHGRYEAHIRGGGIEIHYDVWIGKHGHMTLPSTHTLQAEEKRLRDIMAGRAPETPIVNERAQKKRAAQALGTVMRAVKKGTLSQEELLQIDWAAVKRANGIESYPQSTTCTLSQSVIRWIKTKLTPWL